MKWILVVYLIYDGPALHRVTVFPDRETCERAGQLWQQINTETLASPGFICVPWVER